MAGSDEEDVDAYMREVQLSSVTGRSFVEDEEDEAAAEAKELLTKVVTTTAFVSPQVQRHAHSSRSRRAEDEPTVRIIRVGGAVSSSSSDGLMSTREDSTRRPASSLYGRPRSKGTGSMAEEDEEEELKAMAGGARVLDSEDSSAAAMGLTAEERNRLYAIAAARRRAMEGPVPLWKRVCRCYGCWLKLNQMLCCRWLHRICGCLCWFSIALVIFLLIAWLIFEFWIDPVGNSTHCLEREEFAETRAIIAANVATVYGVGTSIAHWLNQGLSPALSHRMTLLHRHSPVLLLDSSEIYLPCTFMEFLAHSELRVYGRQEVPAPVTVHALREWQDITPRGTLENKHPPLALIPQTAFLRGAVPNTSTSTGTRILYVPIFGDARLVCECMPGVSCPPPAGEVCERVYETTQASPDGSSVYWELRYAFLYPYSGPLYLFNELAAGAHRGDLEHITVRLPYSLGNVSYTYFGAHAHESGRWVSREDTDWVADTHPVVYVGKSAHPSLPGCGTWGRAHAAVGLLPHDHADGLGPVWMPSRVIPVMDDSSLWALNEQNLFGNYTGLLGSKNCLALKNQIWFVNETAL